MAKTLPTNQQVLPYKIMAAGTGNTELTFGRETKQKVSETPPAGRQCITQIGNIKVIIKCHEGKVKSLVDIIFKDTWTKISNVTFD